MNIYYVIDRVPELPYFILALVYVASTPTDFTRPVFAVAGLFLVSSLAVGITLKAVLRTERPVEYHCIPAVKYDIPSLHTLLSIGAIVFIYFVEPVYSLVMAPVGVLYMYSRLKLGLHTRKAVYVGAVVGALLGAVFGSLVKMVDLREYEMVLATLFFLIPLAATLFRLKYLRHNTI